MLFFVTSQHILSLTQLFVHMLAQWDCQLHRCDFCHKGACGFYCDEYEIDKKQT